MQKQTDNQTKMYTQVFVLSLAFLATSALPMDYDDTTSGFKLWDFENSTEFDERDGKIIGGSNTDISSVPYQLSLEFRGRHTCGASVINERFALSAAHCVHGQGQSSFRIRAGSTIRESGGSVHTVVRIRTNERYNPRTIDYDVAILQVREPFQYSSNVRAIGLTSSEPSAGQTAVVSGWGSTNEGGQAVARNLQIVQVQVLERMSCTARYAQHNRITPRMICAGGPRKDSCQGDSGGPLVIGGQQVGIVSWGIGCGRGGYPGVYTNIANSEIQQWINTNSRMYYEAAPELDA